MQKPMIGAAELREKRKSLCIDDIIHIFFTSGTTGMPKPAALDSRTGRLPKSLSCCDYFSLLFNTMNVETGIKSTDVILRVTPIFHIMGILAFLDAVITGARVVIASVPFDVNKALQAIEQERVTRFYAVPAVIVMFVLLLMFPGYSWYDVSSTFQTRYGCFGKIFGFNELPNSVY